MSSLLYRTRDGNGNDIVKEIKIKEFPIVKKDFKCPICHKEQNQGNEMKKIVSSNFTDWGYIDGDMICTECSRLFSLYFYSYYEKKAEKLFADNWNASKDKYGTFYHEIGHAVWEDLSSEAKSQISAIYEAKKHEAYLKWMEAGGSSSGMSQADYFGKTLSRYGATNKNEFFSEAFAQIMSGRMRPVSRQVNQILQEQYASVQLNKNLLDKSAQSGIIRVENSRTAVNDVHFIGKIDVEKYKCVTSDIITDEVVITNKQIEHIKERHPNDYERFGSYFKEIVANPDYIIEANKPNSALILKEIQEGREKFKTILRVITSTDNPDFKNSIITFMKIDDREWNRIIKNKKILYKSE